MANKGIQSLFEAQTSGAQKSFGIISQRNTTNQTDNQDLKMSESKDINKPRRQEPKRPRRQDAMASRSQDIMTPSSQDSKASTGQETKRRRVVESYGIKRHPVNITIRDDYYRAIRLLAIDKDVPPWRLIDEALRQYLESE